MNFIVYYVKSLIFAHFNIFIGTNLLIIEEVNNFMIYTLLCMNCMNIQEVSHYGENRVVS
jgi:hypothetical protein